MKTKLILLLIAAALATALYATTVSYNRNSPARIRKVNFDVIYDSSGVVTSVSSSAVFYGWYVNSTLATDFSDDPATTTTVTYDLLAAPTTTITAAGATVTRTQLAALIKKDAESR